MMDSVSGRLSSTSALPSRGSMETIPISVGKGMELMNSP